MTIMEDVLICTPSITTNSCTSIRNKPSSHHRKDYHNCWCNHHHNRQSKRSDNRQYTWNHNLCPSLLHKKTKMPVQGLSRPK